MSFDELNAGQRTELKQALLMKRNESCFWGELAEADSLVTDDELRGEFGGVDFSPDDFSEK